MRWWNCARAARKEANTRATMIELYDGLVARSQNRWPSLEFDIGAVNSLAVVDLRRRLLLQDLHVAEELLGEDLRAVHPPRRGAWPCVARKPIPTSMKRPMPIAICWWSAPVPPGLMAALTAARSGARVILADEGSALGGSLLNEHEEIGGKSGLDWAQGVIAELAPCPMSR